MLKLLKLNEQTFLYMQIIEKQKTPFQTIKSH